MLWSVIRQAIALLSLSYISMIMSLSTWVMLPVLFGWTPTIVMSGSMEPNIMTGDILVAQPVTDEMKKTIVPGQVLLAKNPVNENSLVTHRVVNVIEGEGFITKGDANAKADPTIVPFENVQGLERLRIPMIGIPLQAIRTENYLTGFIFVTISITSQVVLWREWKLQKGLKEPATAPIQAPTSTSSKLSQSMILTNVLLLASLPFITGADALFTGKASNPENRFSASSTFVSNKYASTVLTDGPTSYFRLNELNGVEAVNSAPNGINALYSTAGVTYGAAGALTNAPSNTAVALNGTQGEIVSKAVVAGPQTLTAEVWFRTTTVRGGQILSFKSPSTDAATDRMIYIGKNGKLYFGIDAKSQKTIQSINAYNDGNWHLVTVTLSGLNAAMYVDGVSVASGSTTSAPLTTQGSWVVSGEFKGSWLTHPNTRFTGSLDEVAIYSKVLTPTQILNHFKAR